MKHKEDLRFSNNVEVPDTTIKQSAEFQTPKLPLERVLSFPPIIIEEIEEAKKGKYWI